MVEKVLRKTRALCPECMEVLPATIEADDEGKVWMKRTCPEHGLVETFVWPDAEHYLNLLSLALPPTLPSVSRHSDLPCPQACGICQRHQRKPTLVEIEVTQRCNLRCPVCFMSADTDEPEKPLEWFRAFYQAIADTAGTDTGIQITGGEPTLREDLADIIRMGREMGFWGIEVNTNGLVIARDQEYLDGLVAAGCTGIYLSFDGLTHESYKLMKGADLLDIKLKAVEACRRAHTQVVLCMTIIKGINDHEIGDVLDYAAANSDVVYGVALQPAFTSGRFEARVVPYTAGDVMRDIQEQTQGLIKVEDIWPLGCSHPMCDTGTFLFPDRDKDPAGLSRPLERFVPATRNLTREEYLGYYNPDSPQGSVFGDIIAAKGIDPRGGISLIIMDYMDASTMDLERMRECSMYVTMPDGRLIPFCSYQLTDCTGKRLYQPWCLDVQGEDD